MPKPKERTKLRRPRQQQAGVKSTGNLFMDGTSWNEVKRKCDEFMQSRGIPKEVTPIFIQQ